MILSGIESRIKKEGKKYVIGADESGRGALAGPICAAAVLFEITKLEELDVKDSKCTSKKHRREILKEIISKANDFSIVIFPSQQIDKKGIQAVNIDAIRLSVCRILERNAVSECAVLVDHYKVPDTDWQSITYGDSLSAAIASASIIAKVVRDMVMSEMTVIFPDYSFHLHKGYGTELHLMEIDRYGITRIHRRSFSRNLLKKFF